MPLTRTRTPPDRSLSASRRSHSPARQQLANGRSRSPRRSRSPTVLERRRERGSKAAGNSGTSQTSPSPLPEEDAPPLPDEEASSLEDRNERPLPNEAAPRLPSEDPPLPAEPAPGTAPSTHTQKDPSQSQTQEDDGWDPLWDPTAQAYYFHNRFTQATQWENPRIPEPAEHAPGTAPPNGHHIGSNGANGTEAQLSILPAAAGGYNPRIHGSYDPNASYAQPLHPSSEPSDPAAFLTSDSATNPEGSNAYTAQASFNSRTGAFSNLTAHPTHTPTAHTDEAKSKRQMSAFFDVDAAANSHDGRSLKEERRGRKLTKEEVRAFREKAKGRREEKKRRWLRD